jgi:hypothetical protein
MSYLLLTHVPEHWPGLTWIILFYFMLAVWCKGWWRMTHLAKLMQSCNKEHGCYSVCFSCLPTSTDLIWRTKLVLHYQIYDETSIETGLKISQLCPLLSVEQLIICDDIVQSLLNMCMCDVCSLIHISIKYRGMIKKMSHLRSIYFRCSHLCDSSWIPEVMSAEFVMFWHDTWNL